MKNSAYYCFEIDPISKARPRFTKKGFAYKKADTRAFENAVHSMARIQHEGDPFEGPLKVEITFSLRRPKTVKRKYPSVVPDIDNFIKSAFDACNKAIWHDDAQIVTLVSTKQYAESGRIELKVEKLK